MVFLILPTILLARSLDKGEAFDSCHFDLYISVVYLIPQDLHLHNNMENCISIPVSFAFIKLHII
jgi:hypothetical protein